MKILAIDTSTPIGSVAVLDGSRLLAEVTADVRARHGETVLAHVEHAMRLARLGAADLELVACGLGPGSFTGLRVGLATAKGLAIARRTPLVGVPSIRVLARGRATPVRTVVAVVDAHKGEVYAAAYRSEPDGTLVEILAPFHAEPEPAGRTVRETLGAGAECWLCGDGVSAYGDRFVTALEAPFVRGAPIHDVPRAALLGIEALEAFRTRGADDLDAVEPLYVRPSDARPSTKLPAGPG